jgi:hypothetical protein
MGGSASLVVVVGEACVVTSGPEEGGSDPAPGGEPWQASRARAIAEAKSARRILSARTAAFPWTTNPGVPAPVVARVPFRADPDSACAVRGGGTASSPRFFRVARLVLIARTEVRDALV